MQDHLAKARGRAAREDSSSKEEELATAATVAVDMVEATSKDRGKADVGEKAKVCSFPVQAKVASSRVMETVDSVMETTVKLANPGMMSSPEPLDPLKHLPPFERLRACLSWWETHAPSFVLKLIRQGVEPTYQPWGMKFLVQEKSQEDINLATEVMAGYVEAQAAKKVAPRDSVYLVPWFVIQKTEPGAKVKNRLLF